MLTALWHRPTISAAPPLTPPSAAAALVGRLGSASLGAVGASTILHNFSGFLFSFLMVVTTPRVARAVANADMAEVGTMQDALLCFTVCLLYVILFPCLCHEHSRAAQLSFDDTPSPVSQGKSGTLPVRTMVLVICRCTCTQPLPFCPARGAEPPLPLCCRHLSLLLRACGLLSSVAWGWRLQCGLAPPPRWHVSASPPAVHCSCPCTCCNVTSTAACLRPNKGCFCCLHVHSGVCQRQWW